MNYGALILYIQQWIKENHNEEVTGDILQGVLVRIVDFAQANEDNLIAITQFLQDQIDNINLSIPLQVLYGSDDPNVTPPPSFNAPDIYVRSNDEVWIFNGAEWIKISDSSNSVIQTDMTIDGDGSMGDPLRIAQNGASEGQVIKWDGTTWMPSNEFSPLTSDELEGIQNANGLNGANPAATMADIPEPIDLSTGLEAIDEGNGIGWRLKGRNPNNYGNIGKGAVDLGASNYASTTVGASGGSSVVGGGDGNEASGLGSGVVGGLNNEASGNRSTVGGGVDNIASGRSSVVGGGDANIASGGSSVVGGGDGNEASGLGSTIGGGLYNIAKTFGEFLAGLYATIKEGNATAWIGTDRIFGIGNGKSTSQRSDAFNVYKNGVAELPSVTNALIDAADGKAIPTKEWVQEQGITLEGYHETGTRAGGDLEVVIGDWDDSDTGEKITFKQDGSLELTNASTLSAIKVENEGGFYNMILFSESGYIGTYISGGGHSYFRHLHFGDIEANFGSLDAGLLTEPRGYQFPDKEGTVALLDDLVKLPKTISDATYILLEEDKNKILHFTNATGVTVTVPTSLTLNNRYEGKQMGAGQVSFIGATGVTINKSSTDTNKTADKYSVFGLDCTILNNYVLYGKLELV